MCKMFRYFKIFMNNHCRQILWIIISILTIGLIYDTFRPRIDYGFSEDAQVLFGKKALAFSLIHAMAGERFYYRSVKSHRGKSYQVWGKMSLAAIEHLKENAALRIKLLNFDIPFRHDSDVPKDWLAYCGMIFTLNDEFILRAKQRNILVIQDSDSSCRMIFYVSEETGGYYGQIYAGGPKIGAGDEYKKARGADLKRFEKIRFLIIQFWQKFISKWQ